MLVPLILLQTLFFKTTTGDIYQAIDNVPAGQCVLTGSEELVFEATNFNTCNEIVLQPGCYRAELRGGVGTMNEYCLEAVDLDSVKTISALFSISEATTVYALRGGDGNAGGVNLYPSGNYTGAFGGGASGVDSILVVNDKVWRANGGVGNICAITSKNTATGITNIDYGAGGGGNNFTQTQTSRAVFYGASSSSAIYVNGGGGGGAPNIPANKEIGINSGSHSDIVERNIGQDGSTDSGGDGGNVTSCTTFDCSELVTATGGKGGKNISYNCGGETVTAYGGGGGGGAIRSYTTYNIKIDGGDGGSGSTGTSNVSFLRIYKM